MSDGWESVARRFVVSGRVQGVGYRAFVARTAVALRLSGGASNLDDGRVVTEVRGPLHAVERLEAALWEGPRLSRVEAVAVEVVDPHGPGLADADVSF